MRGRLAQASLFGVSFVVGMLLVVQLLAQTRPAQLTDLSAQELSELIDTLSTRNTELRSALVDRRREVEEYRQAEARGESVLDVTIADLERLSVFAGLVGVQGEGIIIDVEGEVDAAALNDLINELRNAGAEAIAVNETRITARSVAVQGSTALELDGAEVGRSFQIRAIGYPEGLLNALRRPGGIIAVLEQYVRARIQAHASERIELPATQVDLVPRIGRPVE